MYASPILFPAPQFSNFEDIPHLAAVTHCQKCDNEASQISEDDQDTYFGMLLIDTLIEALQITLQ